MKSTWNRIWKVLRVVIGWWILGIITLIIVLDLYTLPWTGFGDYTTPTGDFVRGRTLWDWMQLLIIPLFLAAGAIAVNRSEKELERQRAEDRAKLEREIATDRQQEAVLQAYLDRMSELLLKEKLRTSKNKEVRDVARVRTLTVLRGLDAKRKGMVILFLHEAKLINTPKPIINLRDADLRGADLSRTRLTGASLTGANLGGANLSFANMINVVLIEADLSQAHLNSTFLFDANLSGANLSHANLSVANLSHGTKLSLANLHNAILRSANLSNTDLSDVLLLDADLSHADLSGAIISNEQLADVKSLLNATMPDGTKHN